MTEEEKDILKLINLKLDFIIKYIELKESELVQSSSAMLDFMMNVVANLVSRK